MATNTWFVMIPPGYATQSTAAKQKVDFRIQYPAGSQAWTDANAGKILSPSESTMGQQLVKWQGPFATEAQAQAAQNPTQQSANPVNDAVFAAQTANIPAITGLSQFFTEVTGFMKFVEKVFEDLVNPKFWLLSWPTECLWPSKHRARFVRRGGLPRSQRRNPCHGNRA